jgi:hypothetical protein
MNNLLSKILTTPTLLWKAIASLVFVGLGISFLVLPNIIVGLESGVRNTFSALLTMYGLFRLYTLYAEIKRREDLE